MVFQKFQRFFVRFKKRNYPVYVVGQRTLGNVRPEKGVVVDKRYKRVPVLAKFRPQVVGHDGVKRVQQVVVQYANRFAAALAKSRRRAVGNVAHFGRYVAYALFGFFRDVGGVHKRA